MVEDRDAGLLGLTRELLQATGDLDRVLDIAGRALFRLIGDVGVVRLVSADGVHLDTVTAHHSDPERARQLAAVLAAAPDRADEGVSGAVMRRRAPLIRLNVTDAEAREMVVPERHGYLDGVGISSILVFPLIVEGEYLGYVCVCRDRGSAAYSDRDIALAEDVAGRIALAIGQARGSQVRRQRTREQQAQLALGVTALGSGDVEELYAAAVTCVADALGGDWVEVAELEGGELVSRATVGDSPDHQRVPVRASSYARAVLDADQPVVVYDLSQTPGLTLSPQARRRGMHSGMAVAIRSPDEMLGVLAVHQRRPRRFSAEERAFLQAVATTVAGGLVRRRADAQLSWRAHHDPLTGLANRTLLLDRLQHAILRGRRAGTTTAVMYLDLDDLKVVNDRLGHAAGDAVLRTVAAAMVEVLRPADTAARIGGDEFVLVCEDLHDAGAALEIAERVRARTSAVLTAAHRDLPDGGGLTLSIGLALAVGGDDADRLVRDADAAMYRAKTLGGDRVELFDDDLRQEVHDRIQLRRDLAVALAEHRLFVVYQPVADLHRGQVVGTEALARWDHPLRGSVPPTAFIAAAEDTLLIDELGAQVLHRACRQATSGMLGRLGLRVSVNVAPHQLRDAERFRSLVADVLAETGLAPGRLCLEITEQASVSAGARDAMLLVRQLGVRWSLDDFGTGYASLAAALDLPVDQIKLDRSLIHDLARGERTEVLAALASLVRACGHECLAEGVETTLELRCVLEAACTHYQGYLLARPMPAIDLDAILTRPTPLRL